jgi:hypothetical protein
MAILRMSWRRIDLNGIWAKLIVGVGTQEVDA